MGLSPTFVIYSVQAVMDELRRIIEDSEVSLLPCIWLKTKEVWKCLDGRIIKNCVTTLKVNCKILKTCIQYTYN